MPLYALGALLMTTDTPVVLCWAAAIYAVWRATGGPSPARGTAWWHAAGIAFAAGLLTKYTILLLVPCVGGFLLTHPKAAALLRGGGPWIGAGWGAAGAIPILVWNRAHDWVSFRHVVEQTTGGQVPWWQSAGELLGSQAGVVSPLLFAGLVVGIVAAGRRGLGGRQAGPLLLFWTSGPVLVLFVLWSLAAKVQANWPAPAYFTAAIAAAAWVREQLEDRQRRAAGRRKALLVVSGASIILGVALQGAVLEPRPVRALGKALNDLAEQPGIAPVAPWLRGAGRLLAEGADPCKRLCGWRALAARVSATQAAMAGSSPPFIVSDRYQLASLLAFYVDGRPRTYTASLGGRLSQYDIWGGLAALHGRDGIFVTYGYQPLPEAVERAFRRVEVEPRVVVMDDGRLLHGFYIVRGYDFQGFPPPAAAPRY
jgi:4-amino-4-deoxy-L-arabinose transferase-like glycosyltransferase